LRRLLIAVSRHGQKNDMDGDVEALFTDLEDRIETVLYQLRQLTKTTERLDDELRQAVDLDTNRVLNTLTILSAFLIPGEFFSGVYGMGFDAMPELHWTYGYLLFWILVVTCWIIFGAAYFRWRV